MHSNSSDYGTWYSMPQVSFQSWGLNSSGVASEQPQCYISKEANRKQSITPNRCTQQTTLYQKHTMCDKTSWTLGLSNTLQNWSSAGYLPKQIWPLEENLFWRAWFLMLHSEDTPIGSKLWYSDPEYWKTFKNWTRKVTLWSFPPPVF